MKRIFACCLLSIVHYSLAAQKKPLDHTVYDSWQHIGERMISNDGKWVVYTIDPQEGDNELVIQSSDATYKKTIPRGYTALITEDSRFVVFKIKAPFKDIRDARIKKKKPEDFPKDSLAIVELGKENVWKSAKIKNYKTPQKASGWVGYHLEKIPVVAARPATTNDKRITDSLNRVIDSLQRLIGNMPKKKKNKSKDGDDQDMEDYNDSQLSTHDSRLMSHDFADGDETPATYDSGSDLKLRNLLTGEESTFNYVLEYFFSKTGEKLLIEQAKNPKDSLGKAQVLLHDLRTGNTRSISKGGNDFKNFVFTDDGSQVAFIAEREPQSKGTKDPRKFFKLWHYAEGQDSAMLIADRYSVGMPLGNSISEFGNLSFSKSGKRLFFGTSPVTSTRDTSLIDIDMPKVDIWHYNDEYLQTVQGLPARLRAEQQQSFLAVYDVANKTIQQLGNKEVSQIIQTREGDGDLFVGVTDYGKRLESQWTGNTLKDVYAVNVKTGEKKLVKNNLFGQVYPSSTGKYIMWYDRKAKHYFSWDGAKTKNISEKINFSLWNEEFDSPDEPNNYGQMGWMENDVAVFVYDKFDIWALDPTGENKPQLFSQGLGRKGGKTYRYISLDPEKRSFKNNEVLLLRSFDHTSKGSGFAIMGMDPSRFYPIINTGNENKFLIGQVIGQNKQPDKVLFTKENFNMNPDLFVSTLIGEDRELATRTQESIPELRLSRINPQQSDYLWGNAELFKWKAYNGKDATGIVYKPENFDPKKKYPMIVYFYERHTQDLYDYKEPAPIRSAINVPFFVSRGYVIFMPDIVYKVGHPGQSAYDYIVSGSRALAKKGWVDSTKMGLQGHSWGGYQAAQVATMTKLFKAVWAGAPVANMTSAYGGIRWESGVSRQFQYERTQSRIGGTLWDKLPLYIENSPLFHLDKVTAPMVIMHNDADGAVPWYQGIELFTGLRRLGKKVWMFNYNGQGHGLTQRQDMKDYQVRMQQFFDWILKGEKPARWITDGVPAVNKGKDWGLE